MSWADLWWGKPCYILRALRKQAHYRWKHCIDDWNIELIVRIYSKYEKLILDPWINGFSSSKIPRRLLYEVLHNIKLALRSWLFLDFWGDVSVKSRVVFVKKLNNQIITLLARKWNCFSLNPVIKHGKSKSNPFLKLKSLVKLHMQTSSDYRRNQRSPCARVAQNQDQSIS